MIINEFFFPPSFQMIESGANRMDCKFVRDHQTALRRNTDPRMKGHLIFSENLSVSFMAKKNVKLEQCWAVGFTILEISKFIMQSIMYERVKPAFDNRVTTILSDTDSWILAVPARDSTEAVLALGSIMDFSNYPSDHPLYNTKRKNQTGYLKNEIPDDEITEVVGVRSKTYAVRTVKTMTSRCKGVKEVTKNKIKFEAFVNCVKNIDEVSVTQFTIQSKKHINRLMKCKKIAFSSFDDKRYLLCGIHSVPYGSILIEKSKTLKRCYLCAHPRLFI